MDSAELLAEIEAKPGSLRALARAADDGLLTRCGPFLERRFQRYRLIGMGASYLVAHHAAARLRSLGVSAAADLASSGYGFPMDAETLTVAISASGATAEVLQAIDRLDGHFPVLALTENEDSALASRAGAVLPLLAATEQERTAKSRVGAVRTVAHSAVLLHGLTLVWTGGRPTMVARDVAVLAERVAAATADLIERREEWLPEVSQSLDAPTGVVSVTAPAERMSGAAWSAQILRTEARRAADATETAQWLHTQAHLTGSGLDVAGLVLTGSRADRRVLDRLSDRGRRWVAVGAPGSTEFTRALSGASAGEIPSGGTVLRHLDDDDVDVARIASPTVAELLAVTLMTD